MSTVLLNVLPVLTVLTVLTTTVLVCILHSTPLEHRMLYGG